MTEPGETTALRTAVAAALSAGLTPGAVLAVVGEALDRGEQAEPPTAATVEAPEIGETAAPLDFEAPVWAPHNGSTLSKRDAAQRLRVDERTLEKLINSGTLKADPRGVSARSVRELFERTRDLVGIGDAARILGRNRTTVYRLLDDGRLQDRPLASGRRGVTRASLENYLSSRR